MPTVHNSGLILISVKHMTVDFGRTARTFICFGAHSNLGMLLLANDDCNFTLVCHIYIHVYACNHTAMATAHDSGLILISVEYTTRCYVDFGRTERTHVYFF